MTDADDDLSSIDFSTFVLSLSTTALYQMGLVDDPDSGERIEPNLALAQQTIDTLEMLQRKTRGNLEPASFRASRSVMKTPRPVAASRPSEP